MDELVHQLAVDEGQDAIARIDNSHLDIERGEDGRILHPDHAAADDGEGAGQALEIQNFVGVENSVAVERDV